MTTIAFWRRWHRWLGFPAALFLCFASITGILVAGTEFFGEDEAKREALRRVVSTTRTTSAPAAWNAPLDRAMATVAARAGDVPVDHVTLELKGDQPTISIVTGRPTGGEDRRFVVDARSGRLLSVEAYADKPFLYRLHSGEAFGDGGLVASMLWGLALLWLTISGIVIYWRMRRRNPVGWQKVFW